MHTVAEVLKLAFADREAWYGDDSPVALADLLDPSYVVERRALVGERASAELRPGSPGGRTPRLPEHVLRAGGAPSGAGLGEPTVSRTGETRGDTCHLDVVDRWGNMISATPSGGWLQSSPTVPELGFCLGSRMQMFWLDEGLPSSLAPGGALAPPSPRRSCSATAGRCWPAAPPAATSRTSGSCRSCSATSSAAWTCRRRSTRPMFHTTSFPESFYPRGMVPAELVAEDRLGDDVLARADPARAPRDAERPVVAGAAVRRGP